ncbi:MAG: hypothetical protein M2R45_01518 [Verrucomicrobia subdivision 3 bacterium]|nr:hypothetical protein [Limisphaerales bacterium]MCS1413354.1 hypothetical protein [Limisphaerales bacterium]
MFGFFGQSCWLLTRFEAFDARETGLNDLVNLRLSGEFWVDWRNLS